MHDHVRPFLRKFVVVFFDDIFVFSSSLSNHLNHLEVVLKNLYQGQLFLCHSKCLFTHNNLHYLRHIVSTDGVSLDLAKIQAMVA